MEPRLIQHHTNSSPRWIGGEAPLPSQVHEPTATHTPRAGTGSCWRSRATAEEERVPANPPPVHQGARKKMSRMRRAGMGLARLARGAAAGLISGFAAYSFLGELALSTTLLPVLPLVLVPLPIAFFAAAVAARNIAWGFNDMFVAVRTPHGIGLEPEDAMMPPILLAGVVGDTWPRWGR